MLHNVNTMPALLKKHNSNMLLMLAYRKINPVEKPEKGKCRFIMFVRLRPGIPSHFKDLSRTGYYPGDKYTDKEPEMLRNLIKMLDKRLDHYDRVVIYDNFKSDHEREILKIVDGIIEPNRIKQYSLMLTNYILPKWLNL